MNKVIEEYLRVDDAKIYYETAGQGEALVFAHAGFLDSGMWDEQFHSFARDYRVVRFDMRGFGKSDPVEGPVPRRQDLLHLLRHLGIEKAALIGCSMGGEIAIDFTLEHPQMVSALVAVSTAPGGFEMQGEPPPVLMEMIGALQQNDLGRASELQLRLWVDGPFRESAQVDARVRQHSARMNRIAVENGTWFKADAQPFQPLDPPAAQRLHDIQVPTLVMAGALDHPELLRAADVMEKEIAGAQKVILADCAHVPNMEKPAEFNQAVQRFLSAALARK